jgi:hypothetical protein
VFKNVIIIIAKQAPLVIALSLLVAGAGIVFTAQTKNKLPENVEDGDGGGDAIGSLLAMADNTLTEDPPVPQEETDPPTMEPSREVSQPDPPLPEPPKRSAPDQPQPVLPRPSADDNPIRDRSILTSITQADSFRNEALAWTLPADGIGSVEVRELGNGGVHNSAFFNNRLVIHVNASSDDYRNFILTLYLPLSVSGSHSPLQTQEEPVLRVLSIFDDDWSGNPKNFDLPLGKFKPLPDKEWMKTTVAFPVPSTTGATKPIGTITLLLSVTEASAEVPVRFDFSFDKGNMP